MVSVLYEPGAGSAAATESAPWGTSVTGTPASATAGANINNTQEIYEIPFNTFNLWILNT